MARSGGLFCRKVKLKNFYDPKTAGGCGVVPILSCGCLFLFTGVLLVGFVSHLDERGGRKMDIIYFYQLVKSRNKVFRSAGFITTLNMGSLLCYV
ncbi:hypothetical protein DF214_14700 [Pectobacterium atrosepticum]|nr:hypothetical protein CVS35_15170 [Pectobacterium atrosepticum]PWD57609.1 hypothetical protein DF214_14700 [Pectobacterium atrosepticum]